MRATAARVNGSPGGMDQISGSVRNAQHFAGFHSIRSEAIEGHDLLLGFRMDLLASGHGQICFYSQASPHCQGSREGSRVRRPAGESCLIQVHEG